MAIKYRLLKSDPHSRARLGVIETLRGPIETPVFMPVGTLATVKTLDPRDLHDIGAQILLGNTYHLLLRPGTEVMRKFGGMHDFMGWKKPILTDSGGFQIFSLPQKRKITEEGAFFRSYIDGDDHNLTPETSIEIQQALNSDIMMVLDHCVPSTSNHEETKDAMDRTHRWALRSLKAHTRSHQSLFAIVQGGVFEDLRKQSADFLTQHDFNGFAVGGLAVGETKSEREDMTNLVTDLLPKDKPRYLMGVGTPTDLLEAVSRGIDMFDCIIPTKLSQQGVVYTSQGILKLADKEYRLSDDKVDPNCLCHTCQTYSRAYMHHLTKCRESLGWRALSVHNSYFYQALMRDLRMSLSAGTFQQFKSKCLSAWNDLPEETGRDSAVFVVPRRPKWPTQENQIS